MRTRELVAVVTAVLVAGVLSSCSSEGAEIGGSAAVPQYSRYGAPEVSSARDASSAAATPCQSLLSAGELASIGFSTPGRQRMLVDVQECVWTNSRDERLSIAVDTSRDLLVDTYRSRVLPIFVPTTVEGMPAVRQRTRPDDNTCTVTTGLGPRQALETEWSGLTNRQTTDPCAEAEEAIALVVRKLPPQR